MSQRLAPLALFATAAISFALLLSGCTATPAPPPTVPPTATTAPVVTPSASATPTPTPTTTGTPTAAGCAPNGASMPAGAVSRTTIDVDGDGVADTEWISDTPTLEFGVTTASGATFSYPLSTASPAPRQGFIARLNDHRIVSIVDDNRAAYFHFFVNCGWVTPKNSHGTQYILDYNDLAGTGSGVGCSLGYVVSFQATQTGSTYTVTKTPMNLNATGSFASAGTTSTVVTGAPATDSRVRVAQEISCEAVTVANGGVTFSG